MMSSCALKVVDSVAKQFIHRFDQSAASSPRVTVVGANDRDAE